MIDLNQVGGVALGIAFFTVVALIGLAGVVRFFRRRADRRLGIRHEGNPWTGPYAPPGPNPISVQHRDES